MHPKRPIPWLKWILILLALVVAGGLFYVAKYSWYERYVWPSTIEGMDAPPPPDRSVWPAEPYPLKIETQRVEVATPQGLAVREITYQVNSLDMDLVRIDAGAFIQEPTFGARPDRRAWQRASRWYPPEHQGTAMGIAGAGNSGTAFAALFAPGLAMAFGWHNVFGLALIPLVIVLVALVIFTAGVFVVDYAFGELFRIILDPGNSTSGASGLLTPPTLY